MVLEQLDDVTLLSEMKECIMFMKMLKNQSNYSVLEIFHYYLIKYNIIKTKFNNYHFNIRINYSNYTKDELRQIRHYDI